MHAERLGTLIDCLEFLREEPRKPRERVMADGVPAYFVGFSFALHILLGIEQTQTLALRRQILVARGWGTHADLPLHEEMARQGLSPDQVVSELAAIEIDFIRAATEPSTRS